MTDQWVDDTRAEYLLRAQLAMAFARSVWRPK